MKKTISLLLSIIMLFSITAGIDLSAYADTSGDYEYKVLSDSTVEISKYNGSMLEINVPNYIVGRQVVSIGPGAFEWKNCRKVVLPNGIKTIGECAFNQCHDLREINIPDNVEIIMEHAFIDCYSLNKIHIPKSVKYIDEAAFYCCTSIDEITLEEGLKEIGESAFYGSKISSIVIPESVTYIGYQAFWECFSLKNITILNNNCNIENSAFYGCVVVHSQPNSKVKDYVDENGGNFCCLTHTWDKTSYIEKNPTCVQYGTRVNPCLYCSAKRSVRIEKTTHKYKTITTNATTSKNGSFVTKCTVCGAVKSKSTIYYPKTIKLSKTGYTYNGKVQTPSVTVKDSKGRTLKKNTDYTVTYAKGRKNVGKYAVKITFKGKYSGSKTLYYTIKPKSTSISKLTSGKKKFTVKWKKQTSQTTGYQIQYSTSSKFKSAKTVTVSKNKTTSKSITKLKAKKKYYVRIRTYKTVGKTKYYSSWSKAKAVTTKK